MLISRHLWHYRDCIKIYDTVLLMEKTEIGTMRKQGGRNTTAKRAVVKKPSTENSGAQIPVWIVGRMVSSCVPDELSCWSKTLEERQSLRDTNGVYKSLAMVCFLSITPLYFEGTHTCRDTLHPIRWCWSCREVCAGILDGDVCVLWRPS